MVLKNLKNVSKGQFISTTTTFSMTLIIATLMFSLINSQCPESCLTCSNTTSCTSCISQNDLFITTPTLGCLPCPIKCQKCTLQSSLTQCTTCSQGYYLNPYTKSCQRCQSPNCLQCNQYFPQQCTICQQFYFLQQSTSSCKSCSTQYMWARTCRENFIVTCQDGYFTVSGQLCQKCDTINGCKTCVSATVCSLCFEGFYITNGKCLPCDQTCKTCNSNTSCTSCPKGYRINTLSKCQLCSTANCSSCNMQDICQQCHPLYYLQNANRTCVLLDQKQSVQNCLRYASNFNNSITSLYPASTILCRTCAIGSYLNLQTNACQYCSLLCETCSYLYRSSKCLTCNAIYGRLIDSTNGICSAKLYTTKGQKVIYLNSRNDGHLYTRSGKLVNFSEGMMKCPGGQVAEEVSLGLNDVVGYQYTIVVKLLFQATSSTAPYSIAIGLNSRQLYNQSITSYQQCNGLKITNFTFSFSVSQLSTLNNTTNQSFPINYALPNTLTFKSSSQQQSNNLLIDIREIVILVKQCHQTCALCQTYQTCIKCKNQTQLLEQENCVDKCSSGYFIYSLRQMCVLSCPKGTYQAINKETWTCQLCSSSCTSCSSSSICLSCAQNFYLYQYQCLATCPSTYFRNILFGKCQKCTSPCEQCISMRECLSCEVGFYFGGNGTCLMACPEKFYADFDMMICKECKEPCYTCKSETLCLSCTVASGLSYFEFGCMTQCPAQYFAIYNSLNQSFCQLCQFPCQQCTSQPTRCTQCITGFLLTQSHSCVVTCPSNYFSSISSLSCKPCLSPCKTCLNSQTQCTSCIDKHLLMNDKCVQSCGEGFYQFSQAQCKLCKSQFLLCSWIDNCTRCSENYYLQDHQCLTECNEGYFKTELTDDNHSRICQKCSDNCKKCFGQSDYCLDCYPNYFLQSNNTCSSTCLSTQLFPGCLPCDYPCYSCSRSVTNCTSCLNSYYYSEATNQCVSECYFGFFKTIEKGFGYCKACVLPCTNCLSLSMCYSCTKLDGTAYYLQVQSSTIRKCVKDCGVYQYKDDIKLMCIACLQPCLTCKNATYCLSCVNGVLLMNGNCGSKIDGCPIGSYQVQTLLNLTSTQTTTITTCKTCPSRCSSCRSQTSCTGCMLNFYLYQQACLDYCPQGSSPIKQLRKCIYCQYPCAQCQGTSSNCTRCSQIRLNSSQNIVCPADRKLGDNCIKYYLMKNECVTECSVMTFAKGEQCVACISPCETCISQTICTSCLDGFYILESYCYATCPQEYYASLQTDQCQKCIYPCRNCQNKQNCLSCQEGYLFQKKCLIKQSCPVGYFQAVDDSNNNSQQNKICQLCDSRCLACMDVSDYCMECSQLLAVHEGKCYDKCPSGYYSQARVSLFLSNKIVSHCNKCPSQCLTCLSTSICQSCVFSYSLLNSKCIKRCPLNYMQKLTNFQFSSTINYTISSCVACVQPCASCFLEQTLCESCLENFYMYEQKCLSSCPQGTYLNQLSQSCKQCPFPCKICNEQQKDIICTQCSRGYYVDNNICVDKCNQKFIDFDSRKCVNNCEGGYMVKHISTGVDFCVRQCQLPYLKDQLNKRCVTNCSSNQYITADYSCKVYNDERDVGRLIPKLKSHLFVNGKGLLNLYCEITNDVLFTDSLPLQENVQISVKNYKEERLFGYRLLIDNTSKSSSHQQIQSFPITFSLTSQSSSLLTFSLYPIKSIYYPSFIYLEFKQNSHLYIIDKVSKIPLQSSQIKIQLKESQFYQVYDYTLVKKNKFAYVGEIIMDFVLILAMGMIIFNKFAKVYHLLIFAQSVFMLVCLDISMPPNLYRFLQGFKYSHFYQVGNWFQMLENDKRYTDFDGRNLNRIESIFGDVAFIKVAGHIISLYCIVIVVGIILYAIRYIPQTSNSYVNKILSLLGDKFKHIKWSHLTDVFVSTFMLVLAGFFFQTIDYTTSKTQQSISIALSYVTFLILLSYCVYFCYKIYKMGIQSESQPRKFVQKGYMFRQDYASFYEGISSTQKSYKNYMIIGKILVYGGLCGILWQYPNFCLAVWIVLEVLYGVVYFQFRPFADDVQNYIYSGCAFVYGFVMVLLIVVNQCQKPTSRFFIPQSQQQRKILLGYFIIVLVLICTFALIIEMIISIMRGSLKPRKLDGELEQYNEVRKNSPNSIQVSKMLDPGPKRILYEAKREYVGYEIEGFANVNNNSKRHNKKQVPKNNNNKED